ncbi:MAG: DUF308 domain-containing protein [Bacilli bacterium]|nr:DUF308 domain-containing protein [Bacilli bacterium]
MFQKNFSLSTVLMGILYFVLGIVFIAATDELLKTFNYILVCICAVIGVVQILSFFLEKDYQKNNYTDLLIGVVFIWVSLVLYIYYGFMINILPILFSLYLFVMAIEMWVRYVHLKEFVNIRRGKYLFLGFVAIVVGLLLIFNPGGVILTYLKVTGVYLILVSLLYFSLCFHFLKNRS